ncbi:CCA tRNA nucleotidyltransferase [Paracoccus saliphilus]|uniref:CCA tRNA nucleotidyltransferase n=1 Tax=Paracoccus saliphilus TaxID=405559 RepID=A0AA46A5X8_9RHOB|nr:CCA tRNA nucleotidyltransferase [Paracoccus saliphilus]WCR04688.1 CCA tRNA nucleotidyltransferase [Paracoccus saliphilus]SIS88451.1 poly(A) polymerase [Paracoccus saliphilus]
MTRLPTTILDDPALIAVLDAVEAQGNRAYLVGGAVRNALLGQPVDDIDIATDARPEDVQRLARSAGLKPVPTGIEHGTVTVVSDGRGFEVTTFRRDVETDGRRAVVAFSDSLDEDAKRRDFTMNALYADRSGAVIDPVGGLPDLETRRLRFVGNPEQRIREDYLRILRFFRFHAWYGRDADPQAVAACAGLKDGLRQIARERIGSEMKKLLAAPNPVASVLLMAETGILPQILPDAETGALADLVALEAREDIPPAWPRRLATLSGGGGCADALRLSRDEAHTQAALAEAMAAKWSLNEAGYRLGIKAGTDYALLAGSRGMTLPSNWPRLIARAAEAGLPISARDLMPQLSGPAVGRGLKAAEALWIESGFTLPAPALIDAALQAGEDE